MLQESRLALPEANVLLNCDTGEEGDVIKELRAISGVSDVKVVFGIYDIIAALSADADEDIKKTVSKIRMIGCCILRGYVAIRVVLHCNLGSITIDILTLCAQITHSSQIKILTLENT